MERGCWAPRTLVLAMLLLATLRARAATGYYPRFSPFFFLCTHHGELQGDGEQGEVLISLHIAGNPTYYVPGQEYHGRYHGIPTRHPGPRTHLSILSLLLRGQPAEDRGEPLRNGVRCPGRENEVSGEWSPELGFQQSPNTSQNGLARV